MGIKLDRWYWCDVIDDTPKNPPQFDRIPEERREQIRQRWEVKQASLGVVWKLYGGQIEFFKRQCYRVLVLGEFGVYRLTEEQEARLPEVEENRSYVEGRAENL